MNVLILRQALVEAIDSELIDLSTMLGDADISEALVIGCISPVIELEAEDHEYHIDVYPITRVPDRATREETTVNRKYRIAVRRQVFGETVVDRDQLIDACVLFADELARRIVLFNGDNWGVLAIEESDSVAREAIESEHVALVVIDALVASDA